MQAATGERPKRRENEVDGTGAAGPPRRAPPPEGPKQPPHAVHVAHFIPYRGTLRVYTTPTGMIMVSNTAARFPESYFWLKIELAGA